MSMSHREKEKRENLVRLMAEHPDLPIVPMVDSEVVADDYYAYWIGSWGHAEVSKYLPTEEHIFFYDEHDMEDVLTECRGWEWYENAGEEDLLEAYRNLDWIDCITVYIGLPDWCQRKDCYTEER